MHALEATDPPAVGEFRLLGRLGAGGMGRVYLGVTRSGRPVAVKVVRTEIASDQAFRARFVREVAAARQVGGFWTASVVAADADAEAPWLATEYVPGPSLQQAVVEAGPLPVGTVRAVAARLAEALAAIHAAGLVHRDLKPANVLLAPDGPKVIDFGIARPFLTETAGLTSAIGTPSYMAPEQIRGEPLSPAADVFGLGGTLVYALTGRGPFDGNPEGLIGRVLVEPPNLDGVPGQMRGLIAGCLSKTPGGRPTTEQLLVELGLAGEVMVTVYGDWQPPLHDPAAAYAVTMRPPHRPAPSPPPVQADPPAPTAATPAPTTPEPDETPDQPAAAKVHRPRQPPFPHPPSPIVARYLFPTEHFRGEWRQHPIVLVWIFAVGMIGIVLLYLLAAGVAAAHELTAGAGFWITVTPYLVGALALIGGVVAQIAGARKRRRQPGIIGVAVTAVATLLLLSLVSPWLMVPLGLGWMAWRMLRWHFDRFMLTDKRVVTVHGVITRYIAMRPLARVADLKYEQTPMGRILNYGTLLIDSAGQEMVLRRIPNLPNPNEIFLRVVEEMYEPAVEGQRDG